MIVVRGTKDRQQKVQAAAFASGTMQQVRHERPSSGQPKLVAGSSGAMEEIQLSRATPPSLPWIDGRRFRNNSEEDRDDAIVIRDRHRHSYVCSRAAEMPPIQPSWSTRYPRDEATSWHGSYFGQASEPRPRVVSSNWSYQRPVQGQVEQSHPWDWKAAPRTQPSHVTMKASSGSTAKWSSWSKPVQDAPKPPQAVTDGALMTNLANAAAKRQLDGEVAPSLFKKSKGLDKLDLLCQATLEIGPLQENPTGCSCPKSKCIALYCDCFKAGRRCDPQNCGCVNCLNTIAESGVDGARSKAIRSILARNPRAFVNAGTSAAAQRPPPGEMACNCIRSRCLKLYCSCFQSRKPCNPKVCTCVGCHNTDDDDTGERKLAIQLTLEKRPDAFETRVKEVGLGCACKNNRCVRKYCECFRTNLACTDKCSCRQCENRSPTNENDATEVTVV